MRALKILVVVMGVLLVVGVAVVIATIVYRAIHQGVSTVAVAPAASPHAFGSATVRLPAGAKVVEMRNVGSRLVLRFERVDGTEALLVLDPETGAVLGTIELRAGE